MKTIEKLVEDIKSEANEKSFEVGDVVYLKSKPDFLMTICALFNSVNEKSKERVSVACCEFFNNNQIHGRLDFDIRCLQLCK